MPRQKLKQRADGRFKCKFGDKEFYGNTQTEALRKRDEYIRELELGYNPECSDKRFYSYAMEWLDVYRTKCNSRMRNQYRSMIEYASTMLNEYIRAINATEIQRLFNQLEGKSQSYISKFCTTIRSIFRAAVQDGIIRVCSVTTPIFRQQPE